MLSAEMLRAAAQTFPAPRLFVERAAASGAKLELYDSDLAIVVRICRKLDGVALAIELAARRVPTSVSVGIALTAVAVPLWTVTSFVPFHSSPSRA
jgi:predicted ATPase